MPDNYGIISLINDFNRKMKNVDKYSKEAEEIEDLYAQAIRIQCHAEYGDVMVLDDFIDCVKSGCIIDYDGSGCLLNLEGDECGSVRCNTEWLEQFKDKYPFVIWFNK